MAINEPKHRHAEPEPALVLKAVVVYEDAETGLRARRALASLPGRQLSPTSFHTRLWRRDLLKPAWLQEQAALDAADADLVMLSLHGKEALPDEVREWLCAWATCRNTRPCALGILLDAPAPGRSCPHPDAAYVQTIAQSARVDLFWGFCDSFHAPARMVQVQVPCPGFATLAAASSGLFHPAGQHAAWGLNE